MWQTIIVFALVLGFKAFAAIAEQRKKQQKLEADRQAAVAATRAKQLGAARLPHRTALPAHASAPDIPRIPLTPPPLIASARQHATLARDETAEEPGPTPIVGYRTLVHEAEGEASASDLARTVAMIHAGVLEPTQATHRGPGSPTQREPRASAMAPEHHRTKPRLVRVREAIRLATVVGTPRSLDPA